MLDMTKGKPMRHLIAFSVPMLLGYLFQQFYVLLDMFFVGHYMGVEQLAGIGATGSLNFLIIGTMMGVSHGMTIPISQAFGAKNEKQLKQYTAHSILLGGVISILLAVFCSAYCMEILQWMNTPADIIQYSYDFFVLLLAGIPLTMLYNLASGLLRALGDSKTPVIILMLSIVLNILLDIILIPILGLGVSAVASATLISQFAAGIATVAYIYKKCPILHVSKADFKTSWPAYGTLCAQGIPMGIQYSITAVGCLILSIAVNGLGSTAVASVACATRISFVFTTVFDALGAAMATYGGQNVGAHQMNRIRVGVRDALGIAFVYSLISFAIIAILGKSMVALLVDEPDPVLIAQAYEWLLWNSGTYILLSLVNVLRFVIQGLGFSGLAVCAGILEMVARTGVAILLVPVLGFTAVSIGSPAAWLAADIFLICAYFYVMHKLDVRFGNDNMRALTSSDVCHA